mmetsp:Transcript_13572/g.23812  ORF Transcript_13572/g.23812 Transcript_13572/m.23812 type:complete len:225 (-) Transcript_13572:328-1002(-)
MRLQYPALGFTLEVHVFNPFSSAKFGRQADCLDRADETNRKAIIQSKEVDILGGQVGIGEGTSHGMFATEHLVINDRRRVQRAAGLTTTQHNRGCTVAPRSTCRSLAFLHAILEVFGGGDNQRSAAIRSTGALQQTSHRTNRLGIQYFVQGERLLSHGQWMVHGLSTHQHRHHSELFSGHTAITDLPLSDAIVTQRNDWTDAFSLVGARAASIGSAEKLVRRKR